MNLKLHKNARTTPLIREEIRNSRETIAALAKKYGLSRKTVRKWKNRESVEDKSSRPNKINTVLTKDQEDMILFERKQYKKTLDEIYLSLRDRIPGLYPMKIYRCLKRYNLDVLPSEFLQEERKIKKFKKYSIGYLHMDVLYTPKINKERRYVFTCIDRVSKVAYVEVRKSKTKNDGAEFLKNTLNFYPYKINYILTDNGGEFCHKALYKKIKTNKIHPFVALCKQHKIHHRTIKFKHPWTNGMVERFNEKIKDKVFKRYLFQNIEDLRSKLIEYINHYNFDIPLRGIGFKTPAEYVKEKLNRQIKKI